MKLKAIKKQVVNKFCRTCYETTKHLRVEIKSGGSVTVCMPCYNGKGAAEVG